MPAPQVSVLEYFTKSAGSFTSYFVPSAFTSHRTSTARPHEWFE